MRFPTTGAARPFLLALGAALALAACSSDSNGPGETETTLTLLNATETSAWYIFVRACGTATWSDDLLGADVLSPGEEDTFEVPAGCHDVRMETDPDLDGFAQWDGITFQANQDEVRTLNTWVYE